MALRGAIRPRLLWACYEDGCASTSGKKLAPGLGSMTGVSGSGPGQINGRFRKPSMRSASIGGGSNSSTCPPEVFDAGTGAQRAMLLGAAVSPAWLAKSNPSEPHNQGRCLWYASAGFLQHLLWDCPAFPRIRSRPPAPTNPL